MIDGVPKPNHVEDMHTYIVDKVKVAPRELW